MLRWSSKLEVLSQPPPILNTDFRIDSFLFPPSPNRYKSSDYHNYHKTDPRLYLEHPIKHLPHSLRWTTSSFLAPPFLLKMSRRITENIGNKSKNVQATSLRKIKYKIVPMTPPTIPTIIGLYSSHIYVASSLARLGGLNIGFMQYACYYLPIGWRNR